MVGRFMENLNETLIRFSRAKAKAQTIKCNGNLKQLAVVNLTGTKVTNRPEA